MKKIIISCSEGVTTMATTVLEAGEEQILVKNFRGSYKEGEKSSTVPNTMEALTATLNKLAEDKTTATIYTIGVVADKINSDILLKEIWSGSLLGGKRELSQDELETYSELVEAIKASYGQAIVQSMRFLPRSEKEGMSAESLTWFRMAQAVKNHGVKAPKKTEVAPELQEAF